MEHFITLPPKQSLDEFQAFVETEFIPNQVKILEQEIAQGVQAGEIFQPY